MAGGILDHFVVEAFLPHGTPCQEVRIAAQQNVRTTAGHVGGDGHCTPVTCLGYDFCFLGVVLGVQHFVGDVLAPQQAGEHLTGFHRYGAHQHRLSLGMMLLNGGKHSVKLGDLVLVHHVVQILADVGLVGGNLHHVQAVNALEFGFFRLGGTCHAGQLFIHAEVILEGDGGQGFAFPLHLHMLLGFDGLMETLGIPAADHQPSGELVHNDDLAVLHHVVHITLHQHIGTESTVDVVVQLGIFGIVQVFDFEGTLHLLGTFIRQGNGLLLFVYGVVLVPLQVPHHHVCLLVEHGALVTLTGNDQRRAGFINQDGVHFVHDGVVVTTLGQLRLADDHVVPQVVKAQLIVGAIGNVAGIGLAAFGTVHIMNDQAHAEPQEAVHLAHPLTVAASQIIVHRHHMDALAAQCIQIGRQGGHQSFALAGLHLGNTSLMQHNAAQQLYMVGTHAQHPVVCLTDGGKGFRQNIVFRFAVLQPLTELIRLCPQLLIRQLPVFILQGFHSLHGFAELFDFRIFPASQQALYKIKHTVSP